MEKNYMVVYYQKTGTSKMYQDVIYSDTIAKINTEENFDLVLAVLKDFFKSKKISAKKVFHILANVPNVGTFCLNDLYN